MIDISEPSNICIIFSHAAVDAYESNPSKYEKFAQTHLETISEGGGQKTGDKLSTFSRKFKHGKLRAVGTIVTEGKTRISSINLLWDKNEKDTNVTDTDIEFAAEIASDAGKKYIEYSEEEIQNYIQLLESKEKYRVIRF